MKTDLHLHGLLSAPLSVYEEIAGRALPKLPAKFESFASFDEYLFSNLISVIQTPDDLRMIVDECFQRLIDDDVIYAEVSFDLMIPDLVKMDPEDFFMMLEEERKNASSLIKINLEIGVNRQLPAEISKQKLSQWIASKSFTSIDLYGNETVGSVDDFIPLYRFAEEKGMKLKAHVGEFGSAASVKEYVEKLHLHAVQHGVCAVNDPRVMEWLAKKGTVLNICPTSNVALGVCASYETHPAKKLFDEGVKITVNTDDYALFGASLIDEINNLQKMGFSEMQIAQVLKNGLGERS